MNIFAASYNDSYKSIFDLNFTYGNQLIWILFSLVTILIIFILDRKFYRFFSYFIYGFSIFLLIIVILFGIEIHGSKSWIRIIGFSFQPSEFVKIGTGLALARYLSGYNMTKFTLKTFLICIAIIGVPFLLILAQPDPGTALVFGAFLFVLFREGLPGWILVLIFFISALFLFSLLFPIVNIVIGLVVIALLTHYFINRKISVLLISSLLFLLFTVLGYYINNFYGYGINFSLLILLSLVTSTVFYITLALLFKIKHVALVLVSLYAFITFPYSVDYMFHNFLKPHQQKRVNILLGKEIDPKGYGYNVNQSKIAIGSGGFSGKGFLEGTQTKLDFVPEQTTDFIFCTVGEEWGFLGTALVIILFTGLLVRIVFIAERQRAKFARIYGYGVASILFIHFAINIGMTIGLFPVIGIPLPFFSYGGSSVITFTILLFIFIRLDAVRMTYLK